LEPKRDLEALQAPFSPEERTRANRFKHERARRDFITTRAALRLLLGSYLDRPPESVAIGYTERGKPELAGEDGGELQFNVSHSQDIAVLAFTTQSAVGVDIEHIRPDYAREDVARRYFAADEVQTLEGLCEADRITAFYDCWTRKEAYMKACAEGLFMPLDSFSVALAPGDRPCLLRVADQAEAPARWTLSAFDPGEAYAGAVAVEGAVDAVSYCEFDRI
jgi:4'-phosphopantetheinyl transferase